MLLPDRCSSGVAMCSNIPMLVIGVERLVRLVVAIVDELRLDGGIVDAARQVVLRRRERDADRGGGARRLAQELKVSAPAAADVEDARARRDASRLGDPGELVELSLLEVVGVDEKAA